MDELNQDAMENAPEANEETVEATEGADQSTLTPSRRDFLRVVAGVGAAGLILPKWMSEAQAAAKKSTNPAPKAIKPGKPQLGKSNAAKAKDPLRDSKAVENEVKEGAKVEGAIQKDRKTPVAAQRINVAIVGAGSQGRNLVLNALNIPGIHFVAVCDIWGYSQDYGKGIIKAKQKTTPNVYSDYHDMLEKEPLLDAVIIATPDWMHSPITVDCLKAGKHVYCEKEMSNTLEGARKMVEAARETGKLLQIGHQRRSNPRYMHTLELIHKEKIIGSLTHTYGQWNRPKRLELGWPANRTMKDEDLKRAGYDTMERFRNWRWYRQYSGGAIADLGSHQIDIFSWFLRANPIAVMAGGGNDYYQKGEWYDHVMAIYEYDKAPGSKPTDVLGHKVRGFYQVLNTSGWGGYYEVFMGDQGVIEVSEDTKKGFIVRAPDAPPKKWLDEAEKVAQGGMEAVKLYVGETLKASGRPKETKLEQMTEKAPHQLHLENFFSAIRNGTALSCPPEVGYETCVTVLKANDAVAAQKRLEFDAKDFHI
jgi:predicted dehydrogenase